MISKIASDAYSQGAQDALEHMNLPGHVKKKPPPSTY